MKSKNHLVRNLALVVLAISAGIIVTQGLSNSRNTAADRSSSPALPGVTPEAPLKESPDNDPLVPPAKENEASGSKTGRKVPPSSDAQDAIDAAVLADANLTLAQFATPAQQRFIVEETVVPSQQARVTASIRGAGKRLAAAFGYISIKGAQDYSGFSVKTLMTRVERLTPNRAVISLFDFTRFRTQQDLLTDLEHKDYGITVVVMQFVEGEWLFVETRRGPEPAFKPGQPQEQKFMAYQPLLGGFRTYGRSS